MPATRLRIVLVTCMLLFIIMEGAKPVLGKKGKKKGTKSRVEVLEKKVEEMENLLKCEPCSSIERLTERLDEIDDEIEKLKNPPTTSPLPPPTTSPPPPPTTQDPLELEGECKGYKVLDEADRSTAYNENNDKCDGRDNEVDGWYRIMGKAGDKIPERTPEECVPIKHCGTHAPGWLNGKHPSVQEGVVTREVCYHWSGDCCKWKNNIKIRNCGGFYVYELQKPPVCRLRYCGEADGCSKH